MIVGPFVGLEYPTIDRLTEVLLENHPVRVFSKAIQQQLNQPAPPDELQGPFCSELVALVYRELGLPVISSGDESTVSPNYFLRTDLRVVAGAIVHADKTQDGMPEAVRQWRTGELGTDRKLAIRSSRAQLELQIEQKQFWKRFDEEVQAAVKKLQALLARAQRRERGRRGG